MEANIPKRILKAHARACPREGCRSTTLKFLYFNNRNGVGYTQPRYRCNACHKLFTRGGRQYNISKPGAVARRNHGPAATRDEGFVGAAGLAAAYTRATARGRPPNANAEDDRREECPMDRAVRTQPSSAEEDEAEVQAQVRAQQGIPAFAAAEEHAHTCSTQETDGASHEHATGSMTIPGGPASAAPGRGLGEATEKELAAGRIADLVWAGRVVISNIGLELKALEADLSFRETEAVWRRGKRKLDEESEEPQECKRDERDKLVEWVSVLKAKDGRVYQCSFERCTRLRAGQEDMTATAKAIMASKLSVEDMDVDHASLSDLLQMERRVRELVNRASRFDAHS